MENEEKSKDEEKTYEYGVISKRYPLEVVGHKSHGGYIEHLYWGEVPRDNISKELRHSDGEAMVLSTENEGIIKSDSRITEVQAKRIIKYRLNKK